MDPMTSGLVRMALILLNNVKFKDYRTDEERARQYKADEEERRIRKAEELRIKLIEEETQRIMLLKLKQFAIVIVIIMIVIIAFKYKDALALRYEGFRFTDQTVMDSNSGLIWARDTHVVGKLLNWKKATEYVKNLNYANNNNWRLPTKEELMILSKYGRNHDKEWINNISTDDIRNHIYWSSSQDVGYSTYSYAVNLNDGSVYTVSNSSDLDEYYVWPVRSAK
jgi:hypothetical protein